MFITRTQVYGILIVMILASAQADFVELRDGRRLEGRILEERPDAIHIEVGSNPEGTIRQVLFIHASEVRSWASSEPRSRPDSEDVEEGPRFNSREHVEQLLRDGERAVGGKAYDTAIALFQDAADLAVQERPEMTPESRVEGLDLRVHALRLMLAALDGKLSHLQMLSRGSSEDIQTERRRLQREWEELQGEIQQDRRRREELRRVEIGHRASRVNFADRERELQEQIALLNQRESQYSDFQRRLEEETVRTQSQRRLVQERINQATVVAREARRELQRRR